MHRKARISNPTFKTSPHICSKSGGITLRSSIIPLLAPQRPQERFRHALWLRLWVDKAVHALAVGFCVGFDNIFLALWKTNKHLIIGLIFVTLNAFVAIFSAQ